MKKLCCFLLIFCFLLNITPVKAMEDLRSSAELEESNSPIMVNAEADIEAENTNQESQESEEESINTEDIRLSPFDVRGIVDKKGNLHAAVVYLADIAKEEKVHVSIKDIEKNKELMAQDATQGNTSLLLGPVELGVNYELKITKDTKNAPDAEKKAADQVYTGTFVLERNPNQAPQIKGAFLQGTGSNAVAIQLPSAETAESTPTYRVYKSDGTAIGETYANLFQAIEATNAYTNSYVLLGSAKVFTRNNSASTYFKYQSTTYYGSTTSIQDTDEWVDTYSSAHIINGQGKITKNSYVNKKRQDPWIDLFIEPEVGGYVYKVGPTYAGFQTLKQTVHLSETRLRKSNDPDNPLNAYVYIAAVDPISGGVAEAGIVCHDETLSQRKGNWYIFTKSTSGVWQYHTPSPVVTSFVDNGDFRPTKDLKMEFSFWENGFGLVVRNLDDTLIADVKIDDPNISTYACLLSAVSYVPSHVGYNREETKGFRTIPDLENGGYFKNLRITDCTISKPQRTPVPFFAGRTYYSNPIIYAFGYNDEYCSYKTNPDSEVISIGYAQK